MKKILFALFALMFGSMPLLAQPVITQQPSDQVVTNGGTAVFTIGVSGTGPFTYQWQFDGTNCDFITTVAGNPTNAYSGDGGLAINAALNNPDGVAVDSAGNLLISDSGNNCIRKVDTNGLITTVASIPSPSGLALDITGNLFVASVSGSVIVKVDTNGILTTIAGGGSFGYWGDGGPATSAGLWNPAGVALDNTGIVYIADTQNYRIRRVDTNGIISTVTGNGLANFFGDGGPATNAAVNFPSGVMVDSVRDLYIADQRNQRIRRVDTNDIITTVAGNGNIFYSGDGGVATNAALNNPRSMTVDSAGNLFIAESSNNRIRKVDTNGIISTVAGNSASGFSGYSGPAINMTLAFPSSVTMDNAGNVLIADQDNSRICKLTTTTPSALPNMSLTLNRVATNNLGKYAVVVSNSGGSVTSSVATLNMPAFIISQPQGLTVAADGSATLSVTAGGTGLLGYQWAFNGTNIDWATNSTLTLTNVQLGQAGTYCVKVSNQFGVVTNSNGVLNVVPFLITSQPQSQSVGLSGNLSFSVSVSGQAPFSYQWQFQNASLAGATNSTLMLTNVQRGQAGAYSVVVSNLFGAVTSSNANLSVLGIFIWGTFNSLTSSMTNVPASTTNIIAMAAGDNHCLALKADGTVAAWGYNGQGQTNVPAGLTNVVSIAAGSTHSLALRGDGTLTAWGTIFPSFATITVPQAATNVVALSLGPGAQHALLLKADGTALDWGNINYGSFLTNMPAQARDIVELASGATYCLALRADGKVVTWGTMNGGNLYSIPAAATNIVAIATSWFGNAALRADGTVLVWGSINQPPPAPLSSLTNVVELVCPFNNNSDILALRQNGTLAEYSSSVPTYPTNNITAIAAGSYNAFAVVGSGPPVFPGLPINRTVSSGLRAYFRAVAAGAMPISYQWNCNGTNVPGATNTVLVLTNVQPVQIGNYYTLTASNAFGMATNGAMFLNEVPLEFSIQPPTLSAAVGSTAKFTLAYTNGVGPINWQWQYNNTNIAGGTNSSLSLTNVQLNQAGTYSLMASNSYGNVTNTAVLMVLPLVFNTGLTHLMMTTNGLQLELDSVYATNSIVIFGSTDLVSWLPIFTNPPATGSVLFQDTAATNALQRFYRAVEQ